MTNNRWYFLPAFLWALFIFYIISMPPSSMPDTRLLNIPYIDKAIHFALFTVFGALLVWGFARQHQRKQALTRHIVTGLFTGIAYGALTEYLQHCCFENRSGNMADFAANGFGTVFGVYFMVMFLKRTGSDTLNKK